MILQSLCLTPHLSVVWTEDRQITNDCCYHHPRHCLVFLNQLPRILQVGKKHLWQHLKRLLANKGGGAYLKMRRCFFFFFFSSKSYSVKLWSASTGSGFILSEPQWQSELFFSTKGGSKYARRAESWGGQRLSPFCFYLWTDVLWPLRGETVTGYLHGRHGRSPTCEKKEKRNSWGVGMWQSWRAFGVAWWVGGRGEKIGLRNISVRIGAPCSAMWFSS